MIDVAAHRLTNVLAPRSIAIVGAKEDSRIFMGTGAVLQALERVGFDGEVHMVNRSASPVFGSPAASSIRAVGAKVDMAAMLVPARALPDVLADAVASGVEGATLLASGLAESGPAGVVLQDRIAGIAREGRMELIGPNCLGFLNIAERTGVWFSGYPAELRLGEVAVLSQSGGVGDALMEAAVGFGIGLSHVVTTGNEPTLAVADVLEYLLEQNGTRAVAVFAEALRKPDALIRAAARAREVGKTIVMLKAGASDLGARNALTHTGSLAGNDAVTDAALRQLGIVRVSNLEELIVTAHTAASVGQIRRGVGVVSLSGGGAGLLADAADRVALQLPEYTPSTTSRLRDLVGEFATVQNPFDVTAAAGDTTFQDALAVIADQKDVGAVAVLCNVPTHSSGATPDVARLLRSIGTGMRAIDVPSVLIAQTSAHARELGLGIASDGGIEVVLPGIEIGTSALAHVARWSEWLRSPAPALLSGRVEDRPAGTGRPLSEWSSRSQLHGHEVPLVDAELAEDAGGAVAAWRSFGGPVAIKGVSAHVPHKSDVGAVLLGVDSADEVADAFERVRSAIAKTGAEPEGVIVAPMASSGVELIVGVTRDPVWGRSLVVGAGGVLVDVLRDTASLVLPAGRDEIAQLVASLRSAPLLDGIRGRVGVDHATIVDVIARIAAAGLETRVVSLEVNPLVASGSGVVGLDALVVVDDAS